MSIDSRGTMDFYRPMLVTAFNAITENNPDLPEPVRFSNVKLDS